VFLVLKVNIFSSKEIIILIPLARHVQQEHIVTEEVEQVSVAVVYVLMIHLIPKQGKYIVNIVPKEKHV
jgi:hypothetical protein